MQPAPILNPVKNAGIHEELTQLLDAARANFTNRNVRKTADALCAAHATAQQHGLHREAAILHKAISILATGGRPKLLTHAQPLFSEKEAL